MKKLLSTLVAFAFSGCICQTPSTGEKVGQIVAVRETGMFCPTVEAEIIRGGFTQGSGVAGAPFHFNVPRGPLQEQVVKAMETNAEVRLKYNTPMVSSACASENGIFATSVEPVVSQ